MTRRLMRLIPLFLLGMLAACNLDGTEDASPTIVPEDVTAIPATATDTATPIFPTQAAQPTSLPTVRSTAIPTTVLLPTSQGGGSGVSVTIVPPTSSGGGSGVSVTVAVPTNASAMPTPTAESTQWPENARNTYTASVSAGATLVIDYSVTLNSAGEVVIYVRDPRGEVIGGISVTETTTDALEVPALVSGTHEIRIAFDRLPGTYSVNYSVRP